MPTAEDFESFEKHLDKWSVYGLAEFNEALEKKWPDKNDQQAYHDWCNTKTSNDSQYPASCYTMGLLPGNECPATMASTSAPQPGVNVKVTNEPAVASWECIQRNETRFLIHFDPLCRVTCDLRAEHNAAFLRFRIPFMPNNSVRAKPLFLHVPPDRIESARIKSDVPAPVQDRLGEAIGLRLDLRQNPVVVIPSTPLVPKDQSTEDAVDALHSLALTTCFAVYFSKSVMHSAETFVRALSAGIVRPHPGLADVASLYSGRGGLQIEGAEFTPSRIIAAAATSPPSYDELALTPPEPVHKGKASVQF
ncbi:putative phosphatidylethanolamine methyltransferase [Diplodia seriata]|uniref:Putative phosphatidylethanolamine methyltransferase n=1 Tax=Diplodia seriata TaxID=420778 RepID=A0A0G2E6X6_9PEZI|nr:putative phosphatidylethanolamine methyltransferase [Diplodia seriata]